MADFSNLKAKFAHYINHNKEKYLYFSGTAYLGLSQNKKFISHFQKGIKKFGLNNGTSRTNNIQLGIYNEAEHYAAALFGVEDCAIVSSGFLASQIAVNTLRHDNLIYAPNTHPSLWLNGNPSQQQDFNSWLNQTIIQINNSEKQNWVLASNSMNNLYPEIYDFSLLENVDLNKNITLVLDDSHGIGINNEGKSAFSSAPKRQNIEVVVVASMAKALGVDAGIILSSKKKIEKIKQSDIFVGASPPAAAGLYAFMQSREIYGQELEKLQSNIKHFIANSKQEEWHFANNFPVFLIQKTDIYQQLVEQKILISAFPYPDKNSDIVNRVVLSSWHKKSDINRLIKAL